MDHFIEYICKGVIRSEDAICRTNKRVTKLAKCCSRTNTTVLCLGIASALTMAVLVIQDQEIKALQKQVSDLEAKGEPTEAVENNTEENTQQEGA